MQTTLITGFTGDRSEIQQRESVLRRILAEHPQCFRQFVRLCNGDDCATIAAHKLKDLGLLDEFTYLDARGRPTVAGAKQIDVAIILSAVKIAGSSGVTFGSPYRTKAGPRSTRGLAASNKVIVVGGSEMTETASA